MADMVLKGQAERIEGAERDGRAVREVLWSVGEALGRVCNRLASAMEPGAFKIRAFDRTRKDSVG